MANTLEDLIIDSETLIDTSSVDAENHIHPFISIGLELPKVTMKALLGYVRTRFGKDIDLLTPDTWRYEDTDLIGEDGYTKISEHTLLTLLSYEGVSITAQDILITGLHKISESWPDELRYQTDK